jgi:hydroxymethylbilane synthase
MMNGNIFKITWLLMSDNKLRIATRKSPLALWQANYVKDLLCQAHEGLQVELIGLQTKGDIILDSPLSAVGGKGLFLKELEEALLNDVADIAVHSMKDVVVELPVGLDISVILEREDPREVFISKKSNSLHELPEGACVGTSSLRRQCQLKANRPDLNIRNLRGNVGTRLSKLDEGIFDAIILAAAGIKRLGLENKISEYLEVEFLIPAIGQGAIGIEMRINDNRTLALINLLNHESTQQCVEAERAFSRRLFGGCQLPIAAYAYIKEGSLFMQGLVGRVDGSELVQDSVYGEPADGKALGLKLAEKLLASGAEEILQEIIDAD